jgi:hypothetical protein
MESGISGSLGLHEGGEKGILRNALGRVAGKWYYALKEKKRLCPRWLDGRGSRQAEYSSVLNCELTRDEMESKKKKDQISTIS